MTESNRSTEQNVSLPGSQSPTEAAVGTERRTADPMFSDLGPLPEIAMRSAHDVRHLHICPACGQLADGRHMIFSNKRHWHGRCFGARHGIDTLCDMPRTQLEKLTIGDIGPDAMNEIIRRLYG